MVSFLFFIFYLFIFCRIFCHWYGVKFCFSVAINHFCVFNSFSISLLAPSFTFTIPHTRFRFKYYPDEADKRHKEMLAAVHHRLVVFLDVFQRGLVDDAKGDADSAQQIVKLLDAGKLTIHGVLKHYGVKVLKESALIASDFFQTCDFGIRRKLMYLITAGEFTAEKCTVWKIVMKILLGMITIIKLLTVSYGQL